ncbi:alpha/beta hydrolase [Sphingobacterium olei]|uniref:Alpha/beta hydrolase n=2 Tax=Sphingobacterium olei TaxID=2571155 RepID=A0A4U0PBM6_9SPHI|nr:alpha/beta hydrolase [Sphingobacterium olei]
MNNIQIRGFMLSRNIFIILMILLCSEEIAFGQQSLALYHREIPNTKSAVNNAYSKKDSVVGMLSFEISEPSLIAFYPPEAIANGTAVIICPGGGYHVLLTEREGTDIAKALNAHGITAFVLIYRLPSDRTMCNKAIGPLQDVQQAIKRVRDGAQSLRVNPNRIGLMGFSAGGHLAAMAGVHHNDRHIANLENTSLKPDFMLLINPVISFEKDFAHLGSRANLIGSQPNEQLITYFSANLNVDHTTPPTFLVHAAVDEVVPVENSLLFFNALRRSNVAASIHIYAKGEHGFLTWPSFEEWFGRGLNWMESMSLIRLIN